MDELVNDIRVIMQQGRIYYKTKVAGNGNSDPRSNPFYNNALAEAWTRLFPSQLSISDRTYGVFSLNTVTGLREGTLRIPEFPSKMIWVECSQMARETRSSHTKNSKNGTWSHSCLTLGIIRYVSRVKWCNQGKGVSPLLHLGVVSIKREAFRSPSTMVANFLYIYIYIARDKILDKHIYVMIRNIWEKSFIKLGSNKKCMAA